MIGIALYSSKNQLLRILPVGLLGLLGLLLSYTRSTWLGLGLIVACLAVFIAIRGTRRAFSRYSLLVIALGTAVLCLLIILVALNALGFNINLFSRLMSIIDASGNSAASRTATWQVALAEWREHIWLGTGPLSFPYVDGWIFSSVLQTLHDSGVIGLFFMLWICLGSMVYTWLGYYRATVTSDRGILLGYLLAQVSLFFTSQFSSFFWGGFTWVLFGLATGHSCLVLYNLKKGTHAYPHVTPTA